MRVGIIGAGRMGRRHIQIVRDLGLELVGIADQSLESLALAASEYEISPQLQFSDVPAMLGKTCPDCVIVATTAPTHCHYTCMAAERGAKYILCEKPMAVSLDECDRMISACGKNGAKLAVNHQMRFMEQYTEPKRIVYSEAFGGLSSVTVVAGNFGMAMNGTHYFEMFRYMTDESPELVTAWFSENHVENPRGPQFKDKAGAIRLATASGKRFYMEISDDQGHGMNVIYAGPHGHLIVDELAGTMNLAVREEQYRSLPTTRYGMPCMRNAHEIEPADVVAPSRAVLGAAQGDQGAPNGEEGRLAVAVLVAAYVSNEQGHIPVKDRGGRLPPTGFFPWA